MKRLAVFLITISLITAIPALGDHIYVSGDVSGTWSADTVFVTGEIRVPPVDGLTIEPGVKVLFQVDCKFIVDTSATLTAVGTESDSIWFDVDSAGTHWGSLRFFNTSENSRLEYCSLKHSMMDSMADEGGAIYCSGSSPGIEHCRIEDCHAFYGGGIACANGSCPMISDNHISGCGNEGYGIGGGIACLYDSNPIIQNNEIVENAAHMGGGGIFCGFSSPIIQFNTISGNWTCGLSSGGGILCSESEAVIIKNVIVDNSSGMGAGICCTSANSTISLNVIQLSQWTYGGGICCLGGSPAITNNVIIGEGIECGDGIALWDCLNPIIANCVIVGMGGYYGGGIYCQDSNPLISNVLIANSYCWENGGGISCADTSSPNIVNCIFWGNTPQQIYAESGSQPVITYSDVQDGWPGQGNIDVDPLFETGPLSDYQLSPISPCIDAGNPDAQYNDPEDPENPGYALWPALGTVRNDMGVYGGGGALGWVGVMDDKDELLPRDFSLEQNYPNPFNPVTTVQISLPVPGPVSLKVFDVQGRLVSMVTDGWRSVGRHEIRIDGSDWASGVYFYVLQARQFKTGKKMVLLK